MVWKDTTPETIIDFPARASTVRQIQENITAALEGADGAPRARAPLIAGDAALDARPTPAADGSLVWRQPAYAYLSGGSSTSATTQNITNYSTTRTRNLTVGDGKIIIPRTAVYRIIFSYSARGTSGGTTVTIALRRNTNDIPELSRTIGASADSQNYCNAWIGELEEDDEIYARGHRGSASEDGQWNRIIIALADL